MRRFDVEYLSETRRGMWDDSRSALADMDLAGRHRVLDVGCGTGEFARVLAAETSGEVVCVDADPALLSVAGGRSAGRTGRTDGAGADPATGDGPEEAGDRAESDGPASPLPVVVGDATRLPVRTGAVDLAACQALLINLPDPGAAVAEFRRVSTDRVAAVEPDNAAVTVESTVEAESRLSARARAAYRRGVDTDVALGPARALFESAGLRAVTVRRYDHVRTVEPPYSERALAAARRRATGAGLADDRATLLAGGMTEREYDDLRADWRAMGRAVVDAIDRGEYRRREVVPFYVTVGRVPTDA